MAFSVMNLLIVKGLCIPDACDLCLLASICKFRSSGLGKSKFLLATPYLYPVTALN